MYSVDEVAGETRAAWYLRQVRGSANIEGARWLHILSGNLSHQIEHHLFPDLPACRYADAAPEVRAVCRKYGVAYTTGPFVRQLASVARRLVRLALPTHIASNRRRAPASRSASERSAGEVFSDAVDRSDERRGP